MNNLPNVYMFEFAILKLIRMKGKEYMGQRIALGWFIILFTYLFIVLSSNIYIIPMLENKFNHLTISCIFGLAVLIIPYIIAGVYAGNTFETSTFKGAFWLSVVPVVSEKFILYIIGLIHVSKYYSEWNVLSPIGAILNSGVLHFTPMYIYFGLISVFVCIATAFNTKKYGLFERMELHRIQ